MKTFYRTFKKDMSFTDGKNASHLKALNNTKTL